MSQTDRDELQSASDSLGKVVAELQQSFAKKPELARLIPDIQIFHNAIRYALQYNEIFNPTNEVPAARNLIKLGLERAGQLRDGKHPWTDSTGLVVRGYVSKIDGSVQPYGLVIPETYSHQSAGGYRLDSWFHGRGENLSELNFLNERLRSRGEFHPDRAIVLHLYGRYCNANKFAGEIDLLEALDHVQAHYAIDPQRLVVRGFSMGGAACWQFATHYAGRWAAAAPGAGFSETADFLKVFQKETVNPPDYEQKLWHMYDATDYALNLFHCPTVAYSGEIDSQRQAAEMMTKSLAAEGMELTHLIGPKTAHSYESHAREEVNRRIDSIAAVGRNPMPREIRFTTWTLRYPDMAWARIEGMEKHWERARLHAVIESSQSINIQTTNITDLTLDMASGLCPLDPARPVKLTINGKKLTGSKPGTDRSWKIKLSRKKGNWAVVNGYDESLHKRPGLQGPIDDAFMDSFMVVTPTGEAWYPANGKWAASEQEHAIKEWRSQFRGEARVKAQSDISTNDINSHNLILFGDPQSNPLIARILPMLPLQWTKEQLTVAGKTYPANGNMPVLIYPNPLNPKKYVVINSGFTYREYDYLNNARQVSKLPDFAVIDLSQPPNPRGPGKVALAGFFNESWQSGSH